MLVSNVNDLSTTTNPIRKNRGNNEKPFSEILGSLSSESTSNQKKSINSINNTSKTNCVFQPKVTTTTLPSGHAYTSFNVEDNLTENDKTYLKSLGWPTTEYSEVNLLASSIAQDRVDGALKGSLTKEYLFGDKNAGLAGLVDRWQGIGTGFKELCSTLMKVIDNS